MPHKLIAIVSLSRCLVISANRMDPNPVSAQRSSLSPRTACRRPGRWNTPVFSTELVAMQISQLPRRSEEFLVKNCIEIFQITEDAHLFEKCKSEQMDVRHQKLSLRRANTAPLTAIRAWCYQFIFVFLLLCFFPFGKGETFSLWIGRFSWAGRWRKYCWH